jgi:hypothetical protein
LDKNEWNEGDYLGGWREVDIQEEAPPIWRDLRGNRLDVCEREGGGGLGWKRKKGWVGVAGGDAYP